MTESYDFNDILIVPAGVSKIRSRKDINPYHNGFLPLMTAPMDTVVNESTVNIYTDFKINVCLPREEFPMAIDSKENKFISYSLTDFNEDFTDNCGVEDRLLEIENHKILNHEDLQYYILIDIANGHMEALAASVEKAKEKLGKNLVLMVGNIANVNTYISLSNAGADFIRVGIGNGGGCLTSMQTGVGYPMASLIRECYMASLTINNPAKIVADGGMQSYSDIIKALALGADYVMAGGIFNKAIESCGDNYLWGKIKVKQTMAEKAYKHGIPVYKKFRGMSTKEVQKKWGKEVLTTSEGVIRFRKVEYTLAKWVENFEAYLRSAMSYSNAKDLDSFIGYAEITRITNNAYNRFNK